LIFRDDDISYFTKLDDFVRVHEIFQRYGVIHTIAVICKDLEKNTELVQYIQDHIKEFDIQVHCWEHTDLTAAGGDDLWRCKETLLNLFGVVATTLYPPWNKTSDLVVSFAENAGLTVSTEKITLSQYVRVMGQVKEEVVNFHYWADFEVILLEPALKIYTSTNRKENICG
jgi:peptidoglycan/xylan/chitin deacetylase (PgdA/CDA1 family)